MTVMEWSMNNYNKNFYLLSGNSSLHEVIFLDFHIMTTLGEYDDHYGYTFSWLWIVYKLFWANWAEYIKNS